MWLLEIDLQTLEEQIFGLPPCEEVSLPLKSKANLELPNMPSYSYTFDELCNLLQHIPTQEAYAAYYLKGAIDNNCCEPELYLRAKRNYPSLLREYHLFLLLREHLPFKVHFNRLLDTMGYDMVIDTGRHRYGIRSFTGTPFSYYNYQRKYNNKRSEMAKIFFSITEVIDLPINRGNALVVNGYWLYDWGEVKKILVGRGIIDGRSKKASCGNQKR